MAKSEFKNIHHFKRYKTENRGTNEKEWILTPNNELCLYKITQIKKDNTSTNAHYSESIYSDICKLIGSSCAKLDLVTDKKRKGIVSYYFLKENEELIDFNALIQNIRQDYIPKSLKCKNTHEYYSITLILEAVKSIIPNHTEYKEIRRGIMNIIIIDSLCDHYDRNSSNIALIKNYDEKCYRKYRIAPTFDNGTSLAVSLPIEIAKNYLFDENGIQKLDDAIVSKIGLGIKRGTSYNELLDYVMGKYYDDSTQLINNINRYITFESLWILLNQNKYQNLDIFHKELIVKKVLYNKEKILYYFNKYQEKADDKQYKKKRNVN